MHFLPMQHDLPVRVLVRKRVLPQARTLGRRHLATTMRMLLLLLARMMLLLLLLLLLLWSRYRFVVRRRNGVVNCSRLAEGRDGRERKRAAQRPPRRRVQPLIVALLLLLMLLLLLVMLLTGREGRTWRGGRVDSPIEHV